MDESNKKQLKIVLASPTSNLYKIVYEGGGEVPDSLKGLWTSPTLANVAINGYLNTRAQK